MLGLENGVVRILQIGHDHAFGLERRNNLMSEFPAPPIEVGAGDIGHLLALQRAVRHARRVFAECGRGRIAGKHQNPCGRNRLHAGYRFTVHHSLPCMFNGSWSVLFAVANNMRMTAAKIVSRDGGIQNDEFA